MFNQDNAKDQAIAQYNSVAAMVAALDVDYSRLEELREEKDSLQSDLDDAESESDKVAALEEMKEWEISYGEELQALVNDSNEKDDEDSAREAIQNDALDVQVRSDWHQPGSADNSASEFSILLCTGGPAVRIIGELDQYQQPYRAWIEYQDWGTPWTMLDSTYINQATLLQYCQQFYFGE